MTTSPMQTTTDEIPRIGTSEAAMVMDLSRGAGPDRSMVRAAIAGDDVRGAGPPVWRHELGVIRHAWILDCTIPLPDQTSVVEGGRSAHWSIATVLRIRGCKGLCGQS